MLKSVLRPKLN